MRAAAKRRAALVDLAAGAGFENSFVRDLPADPVLLNVPRQVSNACYTRIEPTPVAAPKLLAWSDALGELLGLSRPGAQAVEALGGNRVLPGMQPYAARYGGHQFGHWAGQLGDGRAITLAEIIATDGSRQELQLKGAGKTPYSRTADGRAVLRSSLREFMCSEAMFHLGVPTTRALSLVGTGEPVIRDMFYDGHPRPEPGAIVCRVAPSFVRFGNFQILAANNELDALKRLADYVIREHFAGHSYADWYQEVCRRTALLMVDWMRLGFVHGVMNTDNLSILGVTIDYGPYGWLEGYDPMWTPNTTDAQGRRYCYGNQPGIAQWNLARLAEALLPLIEREKLEEGLNLYADTFNEAWRRALAQKLGLASPDEELARDLLEALSETETDFTLFFRKLAAVPLNGSDEALLAPLRAAFYVEDAAHERLVAWLRRYVERVRPGGAARAAQMDKVNPKYVFRNYLAQQAIDALEAGDASVLERLMRVLARPYDEQPEHEELAARRPEWARHKAGCSALSCSS
ncbi:MAG: YdiU family protein [Betaproteobacteria bacterium]|nr:MAG: YdiU family protein [Betaproteobacteria bacterium]